jgi:hypothetical protein
MLVAWSGGFVESMLGGSVVAALVAAGIVRATSQPAPKPIPLRVRARRRVVRR